MSDNKFEKEYEKLLFGQRYIVDKWQALMTSVGPLWKETPEEIILAELVNAYLEARELSLPGFIEVLKRGRDSEPRTAK